MGIEVALIQPAFGAGDVRKLNICTPPLGLAYMAAFLREHGHRVTIIDAEVEQLNNEQIAQRAKNADLAAITTTAPTYSSAIALANRIKQSNNPTKVVLDGPQATFIWRFLLSESYCKEADGLRAEPRQSDCDARFAQYFELGVDL